MLPPVRVCVAVVLFVPAPVPRASFASVGVPVRVAVAVVLPAAASSLFLLVGLLLDAAEQDAAEQLRLRDSESVPTKDSAHKSLQDGAETSQGSHTDAHQTARDSAAYRESSALGLGRLAPVGNIEMH